MTREELMANRILPKEVVDIITESYHEQFIPDYHEEVDEDKLAEIRYISPEKIQRMPPEEIVDELVVSGYPQYEVRDAKTLIHVLSVATGRAEDELRNAIFGVGDFDAKRFYQPTEKQKAIMKAVFSITERLKKVNIDWMDYEHWPKDCKDDWTKVFEDVPDEAVVSEMNEVNEYIAYYSKHGVPLWLY